VTEADALPQGPALTTATARRASGFLDTATSAIWRQAIAEHKYFMRRLHKALPFTVWAPASTTGSLVLAAWKLHGGVTDGRHQSDCTRSASAGMVQTSL
jgi:hypothetical protein